MALPGFLEPPIPLTPTAPLSSAGSLVTERFNNSQSMAEDLWSEARALLDQLGSTNFTIDWDRVELTEVPPPFSLAITSPIMEPIEDIVVEDVPFSYSPPDPVDTDLTVDPPPEPSFTDPQFQVPVKPSVDWPVLDADQPTIRDPDIPVKPDIDLPPVPTIEDVNIPSPPEYNIPDFEDDVPVEDLTPPDPQFVWNEAEYNSDIRQKLAEVLYDNLVSGGSGLDEATEQAIYDRATSRHEEEEQEAYNNTLNFFASRGHALPPGGLSGALLEVDNKILRARTDLNNDILIQQSKLAQENTHFIIDRAIANEKNLMDYTNEFQDRAFEAAKFVTLSALEIYKAKVLAYTARVDVYKAKAQVYAVRIQGETAKAEFYKAQIAGIQASVDVKRTLVEAYRAQVAAVTSLISLYTAEMEGARLITEIDRTKVQSYTGLIQAYTARVGAVIARYNAYQAEIAGEAAKAEFYKAQVDAYNSRVNAYRTEVDAEVAALEAKVKGNENEVNIFKARVSQYLAQVDAAIREAETKARNEGLKVETFRALVESYNSELQAAARVYLGMIDEQKNSADLQLKTADIAVREAIGKQEIIQGNIRAAGQIAAQMAASAIAAVSASAHLGYREGRQDSQSYGLTMYSGAQRNESIQVINQHIYQED